MSDATTDLDAIKDRVRKLMAIATEGNGATDAEIETYMKHASKLIDAYHLEPADYSPEEDKREKKMGSAVGLTQSPKIHAWETTLSQAVEELFGCVKVYMSREPIPYRPNGIAQFYSGKYAGQMKMCRQFVYYGPELEEKEAASLYQEWVASIATMGTMRWGGAYRGDGAMYCQGFAYKLYQRACAINNERSKVVAKALHSATDTSVAESGTAIMLSDRYKMLRERAEIWMEIDQGVTLTKTQGHTGSRKGNHKAYEEGLSHGGSAEFSRKQQRKQLPGS